MSDTSKTVVKETANAIIPYIFAGGALYFAFTRAGKALEDVLSLKGKEFKFYMDETMSSVGDLTTGNMLYVRNLGLQTAALQALSNAPPGRFFRNIYSVVRSGELIPADSGAYGLVDTFGAPGAITKILVIAVGRAGIDMAYKTWTGEPIVGANTTNFEQFQSAAAQQLIINIGYGLSPNSASEVFNIVSGIKDVVDTVALHALPSSNPATAWGVNNLITNWKFIKGFVEDRIADGTINQVATGNRFLDQISLVRVMAQEELRIHKYGGIPFSWLDKIYGITRVVWDGIQSLGADPIATASAGGVLALNMYMGAIYLSAAYDVFAKVVFDENPAQFAKVTAPIKHMVDFTVGSMLAILGGIQLVPGKFMKMITPKEIIKLPPKPVKPVEHVPRPVEKHVQRVVHENVDPVVHKRPNPALTEETITFALDSTAGYRYYRKEWNNWEMKYRSIIDDDVLSLSNKTVLLNEDQYALKSLKLKTAYFDTLDLAQQEQFDERLGKYTPVRLQSSFEDDPILRIDALSPAMKESELKKEVDEMYIKYGDLFVNKKNNIMEVDVSKIAVVNDREHFIAVYRHILEWNSLTRAERAKIQAEKAKSTPNEIEGVPSGMRRRTTLERVLYWLGVAKDKVLLGKYYNARHN